MDWKSPPRLEWMDGGDDLSAVIHSQTETFPDLFRESLDPLKLFGRDAPLHVDLGCGDGLFLSQLAHLHPEKNFLGVEKLASRVAKACRKSAHLENVRILKVESAYAVRYLLSEASVEAFYLLFPDPWPKRRHHRRRIVTDDFLDSIHRALAANGVFRIATDESDYFQCIVRLAQKHSAFSVVDSENADLPVSKFQRRFLELDVPIYRLSLRKISPVR